MEGKSLTGGRRSQKENSSPPLTPYQGTGRRIEQMGEIDVEEMTIGQLARKAVVGVETIRYYQRRSLLERPARRPSGYRRYGDDSLRRLLFIRRAKSLGFTLKEVQELLSLRGDPDASCRDFRGRAEAKIACVEEKIRELRRIRRALRQLTGVCSGGEDASECPILDALEEGAIP